MLYNKIYLNIFKISIAVCPRIKSWLTKEKKAIYLKNKKRSGSHLEFMEIIRKDICFILQHHVFKLVSNNLQLFDICRPLL